jgi:hypothetical protein
VTTASPDDTLSDVDREALERALELARAESPTQCKQIDGMLAKDGWDRTAEFAAYCCQDGRLKLRPWETPPCWIRGDPEAYLVGTGHDYRGLRQAALLLKRLLAAGLSKYEPDPETALGRNAAH